MAKMAAAERLLITEGMLESAEYSIDPAQVARIMGILRSSLYTRKALAVMREYSSNGWDAHRMFGLADIRLKVQIPTHMKPTFKCRDFGPGLSRRDVLFVYTQYGSSTKRDTNEAVGALGIGSKSAFCIGDRFVITSWHEGTKSVYSAALDKSNKGRMELLEEEDCGDETGIEIQVAVDSKWIFDFEREAKFLFRYMRPQPEINVGLQDLPAGLASGFIRSDKHAKWIAVMGCVPYRIDLDQLVEPLKEAGIWDNLQKLGGGIYVPIGEVEFAANREELQYTDETNAIIVAQFRQLIEEYVTDALTSLQNASTPGWDRRLKATFLAHGLGFPLPKRFQDWSKTRIPLWVREEDGEPTTFRLLDKENHPTRSLPISPETKLLFKDSADDRKMQGWHLFKCDIIVELLGGATEADAKKEMEPLLGRGNLDGIAFGHLTERSWYAPYGRNAQKRVPNAKHRQRTFKMTGACSHGTLSENWEKTAPPTAEHPFFILSSFKVKDGTGFYSRVQEDKDLAAAFGLEYPEIYGYKTTAAKPVAASDIDNGVPYNTWRQTFFDNLMTAEIKAEIRTIAWSQTLHSMPYRFSGYYVDEGKPDLNFLRQLPRIVARLTEALGAAHPVVRFLARPGEAKKDAKKISRNRKANLDVLAQLFPGRNKRTAPQCALDRILKAYPMLSVSVSSDSDLFVFLTRLETIIQYILDIDGAQK